MLGGGLVSQVVSLWITLDPSLSSRVAEEGTCQLAPECRDLFVGVLLWEAMVRDGIGICHINADLDAAQFEEVGLSG